jgi:hypothetical protein
MGNPARAQSAPPPVPVLDSLLSQVQAHQKLPGFDSQKIIGAQRNILALAQNWSWARGEIESDILAVRRATSAGLPRQSAKPLSNLSLGSSRYSGFTQSETSTAWCGSNVVVAFNDTGSEINNIAANSSVSMIGFSVSTQHGRNFTYRGGAPVNGNPDQMLIGDPVMLCASPSNFSYSALWLDLSGLVTGVAFAGSSDGGNTFSSPVLAVSKSYVTDIVTRQWLAADPNNPNRLYVAYTDYDYSGNLCGTDPDSGSPIVRYAIELVSSGDGGITWSPQPTVVEQVCANSDNPNAGLEGEVVGVDQAGSVYVAWEAIGVNGGSGASRELKLAKSIDAGGSFSVPGVIYAVSPVGDGADLQGFIQMDETPRMAIGKGKKDAGFLYLTWNDGAAVTSDLISTTAGYGFSDIRFTVSKDGGNSWSGPIRVNNNSEGSGKPQTDQFDPAIGADKTGRLAICFYDRRLDSMNFKITRECATSSNVGATWANLRVPSPAFPSAVGQDLLVAPDYMGIYDSVATDGTGQSAGFMDSYASNSLGHPAVMIDHR